MCGIVNLKRNDGYSPIKPLLSRYNEQKGRGQQGFGFVAVKDGKVVGYERSTTFSEIETKINQYDNSDEILMHHRLPTSTENLEETAHPIMVSNKILKYDYYLVHNGVITNPTSLKKKHEDLGFDYNTEVEIFSGYKHKNGNKKKKKHKISINKNEFNDSEALAIEFALWNEGITEKIETTGSVAFVCYQVNKNTNEIISKHYGRNMGNPLKVFRSHGMFVLSSESTDQGSINIEPYKCFTINYKDNSLAVRDITLNYTSYSVSNSCGVPANSDTDCDYKYKTSKHSIGFNTHRIYAPSTIADDVEGVKPTTILLGNSITNNNNTVFICNTTGRITTNCYCKLHIELTKSLKAKEPLKIGTENGEIITYPKKIRSPYNMDSSRDCEICGEDNTIEPMTYDTVENCWIHSKCESPKIFDSIKNEDEFVEQARIQRIQLVSEVEKLEEIVDDLSEEARVVEHNNSDVEKWFKLQSKIDVVKRDIDNKNRLIIRAEEFIGNQIF